MGKGMKAGKRPKQPKMGNAAQMAQMQAMQREMDKVQPDVVAPDDVEMLQDLIMAAANEALRQMEDISQQEMGKFTQGLGIPGL